MTAHTPAFDTRTARVILVAAGSLDLSPDLIRELRDLRSAGDWRAMCDRANELAAAQRHHNRSGVSNVARAVDAVFAAHFAATSPANPNARAWDAPREWSAR